jgi:hypothetical protein
VCFYETIMRVALSALLIGHGLMLQPATAEPAQLRPDRVRVEYVPPKNADHKAIHELLKERRFLEKFKAFLSPLRLPRALVVKVEGCDGTSNAWYDDGAVTVCYEYLDEVRRNAPTEPTPEGITHRDAIMGPTLEVFLHEVGHAVFDHLEVPVLGREEDAADQFAAYILLKFGGQDVRRLIGGVAYMYGREASVSMPMGKDFSNEHGVPAQRFYNLLCVSYGSDAKLFADIVANGTLPKDRAERCEEEFQQVDRAMKKLIRPYVDPQRVKRARAQRWLSLE